MKHYSVLLRSEFGEQGPVSIYSESPSSAAELVFENYLFHLDHGIFATIFVRTESDVYFRFEVQRA